ncbi:VOC family protein [Cryobacterium sp. BB736]|uniref:VOC family protein n=1 Tax=Cryobacterium sp. BB736 TaxID=2746963 RepID=UPI00187719F3|nr:VOC family protein [Cryobacterium sp. BB736]
MTGRVVHFEIPADDFGRATEFYRSAFGWDISPVPDIDYAMLGTTPSDENGAPTDSGAINGGLMLRDADRKSPIVTIDVDDIEQALEKITTLGGRMVMPKQDVLGMGYSAYFTDSEGNLMGLWQNA